MTFFRALFLLLVFANLGFYAWARGYFGGHEQGREPQRLASQIAPERLTIVPGAATAAPVAAAGVASTAAGAPAATQPACQLVTGLPLAEAEAFKAALAEFAVDIRPVEGSASYWVHIPPQANKAAAEKKAGELRALGIKDFYIVQDEGPALHALSLGLFKNEAAATEFLQGLAKRGVKSARIETRTSPPQQARAFVKGTGEALDKRLPELLAKMPGAAAAPCP
jgi:hypothetical protein